eukprot:COSAG01_NODE_22631_length_847_cov_7.810160_2_plen_140_part_01
MAIPEAAEFLFCRFRRFREIRSFLSDRQSESPLSRCFGSHQEIFPVRVTCTIALYDPFNINSRVDPREGPTIFLSGSAAARSLRPEDSEGTAGRRHSAAELRLDNNIMAHSHSRHAAAARRRAPPPRVAVAWRLAGRAPP